MSLFNCRGAGLAGGAVSAAAVCAARETARSDPTQATGDAPGDGLGRAPAPSQAERERGADARRRCERDLHGMSGR